MRSISTAFLVMLAAFPAVSGSSNEVNVAGDSYVLTPREHRVLQDNVTSTYTAIWYFVHEGSCAGADEPSITLSCANGNGITVDTQSEFVSCGTVDASGLSVNCTTAATNSSGHAVDFSCSGASLDETVAAATMPGQTTDCLGGDQQAAEWGHGLLLSLVCGGGRVLNGTCTPLNTTFPDSTCTSGWSCPIGNCTVKDYTINEMTSSISSNDCTPFEMMETSASNMGVLSTTVVAVATMTMLLGGW